MSETVLGLTFHQPSLPLSTNRSNSMHWAARERLLKPWLEMAWWLSSMEVRRHYPIPWVPVPVSIHLELEFRTATRRDPHNYVGTNVKAVVDGLVRGGLIPDDTPEWATIVEPTLTVNRDRTQPLTARVTATRRSPT